ncbi:MAG: hypothetical protein COW71_11135 [Ignavibacteriales bacterium CG18_big_fil_WC_8_21_14_2_50_31_20]|nr:MAG: hypothetical protein COW71_11135 [Ignavibacteriales bacterium CG18_big_fil_WC_8_21_14_2_50_31_20]
MNYKFGNLDYKINRYPVSTNKSLIAWNSADELILNYIDENKISASNLIIYNDRFGFLASFLSDFSPSVIVDSKSQEMAIALNLELNDIDSQNFRFYNPLDKLTTPIEFALIKIPKSMELFRLYLEQLAEVLDENSLVICGFMTKYFTSQILEIAKEYFYSVEQSLAVKKSRLLILKKAKSNKNKTKIIEVKLNDNVNLKQYPGVFSSKNIDYATQFLIEHINLRENDSKIMDLASGNGVLAYVIKVKNQNCEIHLVDDSFLSIESAKLNISGENIHFHYTDNLNELNKKYFDFIISNPPFHFEHETNIEIALSLFEESIKCLKEDGHLQLVANKHLNYKTHLSKIFNNVVIKAENEKFIIYDCFF